MKEQEKIHYKQLEVGYELPCINYKLKHSMINAYLKAVKEDDKLYRDSKLAPPMAVAAYAMNAISDSVFLPPGIIYTHGEIEFLSRVKAGDVISCCSRVSQKLNRGDVHFMTLDFSIFNQNREAVIKGKTGFILPEKSD